MFALGTIVNTAAIIAGGFLALLFGGLLQQRHQELTGRIHTYDKRVALLEEEMDELCEAMAMMRPYLED